MKHCEPREPPPFWREGGKVPKMGSGKEVLKLPMNDMAGF
jgi:hypothetical protein